jgi:ComF family protein
MRRSQVYRTFDRCIGWLLPARCVLCRRPGQLVAYDLCRHCEADIPLVTNPCPRCGLPRDDVAVDTTEGCAWCRAQDLPYSRCVAPWAYDFPVTRMVQALKYEGALANARIFGARLAAAVANQGDLLDHGRALIVPMPLHVSRLVERGFNQSHEIARIVSRLLDLQLAGSGLRRIRSTAPQVGLTRQEHVHNLDGAFAADSSLVAGRHVALIDDVVTTGSTVAAAARALRLAGAAEVVVWAAARAGRR